MKWQTVKLGDICDLLNGYAFKASDYIEFSNVLNCRMSNIRPTGQFEILYHPKYLPDNFKNIYEKYLLTDDDVIIAMTDLAGEPKILGMPTIVKTNGKHILLNQRVGKLIFKDTKRLDVNYLKHVLSRPQVKEYYKKFAGGGLQINLGKQDLLSIEIPLPPLAEQQRIAEILDKANEIKNKRERTIAMLSGLVGSIFEEKFGNPINNTFNWKIAKLVDVCDRTGEYGAGVSSREYSADLPRYIRITDITEAGLLEDKKVSPNGDKNDWQEYVLNEGDIVFARSGATVGKTYLHRNSDEEHIFAGYLIRFRPNRKIINSDYLFAFTKTNFYKAWVKSRQNVVAQPNINAKQYGYDLELPVPPIALQNTFANEIASINSNLVSQKMALDKINTLIKSLQNQAFTTGFTA